LSDEDHRWLRSTGEKRTVTGDNNNNIIILIIIILYKHADSTAKWTITEPTQHTNTNKRDTHEANSKQTKYHFNNNNNNNKLKQK